MARYIDAEKIVFWIRHVSKDGLEDDVRKIAFSDEIARMPTADVAPRAEVAREIFEEIERNVVTFETPYQILHCIPQHYITTLKKKYTEVQK